MQVRVSPIKQHVDSIAASILRLGMQRLMHVAKEVHHEPQTLSAIEPRQARIRDATGVVCDRTDHAAFRETVSRHVDPALAGRIVLRVNVVPACGVGELRHVAHFVGEEGRFGNVLAVEEEVGEGTGLGGEVHAREVGDGAVAEAAPCGGKWEERRGEKEEERQHFGRRKESVETEREGERGR